MEELKLDKKTLRKFGITMGLAFLVITGLILFRHRHSILPPAVISLLFFILAIIWPLLLKPIYILWMKLALVLGWVNSRLLLITIFYLVFAPISLALKLFKVDPLDRGIEKRKGSYWKEKEKKQVDDKLSYERQF